jgi:hypothetical protein
MAVCDNGGECVQPEELRKLLESKASPICYDGFEPSGRMHLAQGVMKAMNVNRLTSSGCVFVFWVADWFALLNNKMGGDLDKIKTVGKYFIEVWKAVGKFKKGPRAVMDHLSYFNPKDTAVMDEQDKIDALAGLQVDSNATIQLIDNKNDEVNYTAKTNATQLAVFSEIYYKDGWKAYVDEKESPIVKVNYVLRGLVVPAGDHKIRFEFKPASVTRAKQIAGIASILLWLALAAFIAVTIQQFIKKQKSAQ